MTGSTQMKCRYLWAGVLALTGLAACGPSSSRSSGSGATTSTTASTGISSQSPTSTLSSAASAKPLPAPCTLLTKADVAPLFGTTALNAIPSTGPVPGTAQCAFGLTVGSQGLSATVETRIDYANDPSYIFPQGATVAGIGDLAIISSAQQHAGDITVRLGKNAISIHVEFYTKPVDTAFLTKLAKDALARV
jgi:hypothetical protein